jgi:hypothetical protein
MKDSDLPTGAAYSPGYVTPEEEQKLVASLDGGGWSSELKRRVQHFGADHDRLGARYEWTHEIPTRRSDAIDGERLPRGRRISLTFRKVIHAAQISRRYAG